MARGMILYRVCFADEGAIHFYRIPDKEEGESDEKLALQN